MSRLSEALLLLLLLWSSCPLDAKRPQSKTSADSSLNFLVLGDWGGKPSYPYTTTAEVELAKVMGSKASEISSMFTLALGDNFYDTGVRDVNDKRFNETFEVQSL